MLQRGLSTAGTSQASQLTLPQVVVASQLDALQTLCSYINDGVPHLLQSLITAPMLIQGQPNARLLRVAALLTEAADLCGSAKAAALAATVARQTMLLSVCRGFSDQEGEAVVLSYQPQL